MEQRRSKRFDIRLPLKLVRNGSRQLTGSGETKNMSSSGVLFCASERLEVGEPIEYVITLSPGEDPGTVDLHCLGKVMRSGESDDYDPKRPFRIAATLERYEFVRAH